MLIILKKNIMFNFKSTTFSTGPLLRKVAAHFKKKKTSCSTFSRNYPKKIQKITVNRSSFANTRAKERFLCIKYKNSVVLEIASRKVRANGFSAGSINKQLVFKSILAYVNSTQKIKGLWFYSKKKSVYNLTNDIHFKKIY